MNSLWGGSVRRIPLTLATASYLGTPDFWSFLHPYYFGMVSDEICVDPSSLPVMPDHSRARRDLRLLNRLDASAIEVKTGDAVFDETSSRASWRRLRPVAVPEGASDAASGAGLCATCIVNVLTGVQSVRKPAAITPSRVPTHTSRAAFFPQSYKT
jgi:hypothetical protein